jgi:protein-L-isoaspartate(D-aspartate) O-methyltransferase
MRSSPTPKKPQPPRKPEFPGPSQFEKKLPSGVGASASAALLRAGRTKTPLVGRVPFVESIPVSSRANHPGLAVEASRVKLVQALQQRGVRDVSVLQALVEIDRHLFVDAGFASLAYQDEALPIGFGQTISKPSTVARMLELMGARIPPASRRKAKVLEVGTGCGYQAACMAKLFGEIYSIERVKGLHELARKNLRSLRLANLRLVFGDGYLGVPSVAPFDAIIVAAAAPQVPQPLMEQLRIGGRLVIPVGEKHQVLQVIDRIGAMDYEMMEIDAVRFVPLVDGTR